MMKSLKKILLNLVAGANIATIALMLLTGFSDRVSPEHHPLMGVAGMTFPFLLLANLLFLFLWLLIAWKRIWIPIAGFALAYVPITIYMPLNSPTKDVPEGAIHVLSYNVQGYGGNDRYRDGFDTIVSYIRQGRYDIVCLQEDIDTWRRCAFKRYGEFLPYNDTTKIGNGHPPKAYNCLGLHSRFPILRKEKIAYPSTGNGSVAYYLLVEGDTLLVINNHLEITHLSKEDRSRYKEMVSGRMERDNARAESRYLVGRLGASMRLRAPQAEAVARYISEHRQYPIIVCGDLNDTPISYTRRTIAHGLTDCFVATGRGFGLSYNQKGFNLRIDQMLCSDHFTPYNCRVDDKMDASDHYPMSCWLQMRDIFQKNAEKRP